MVKTAMSRQRGITFIGLVFMAVVLGSLGVVLAQVVPTAIEFAAIQRAATHAATGNTPEEVRSLFSKAAMIDNITSVRPDQLDIGKEGDRVVVSFAYQREIHLVGPAWLTLKYRGQSN